MKSNFLNGEFLFALRGAYSEKIGRKEFALNVSATKLVFLACQNVIQSDVRT